MIGGSIAVGEAEGDVGIFGSVAGGAVERDVGEADLFGAFADEIGDGDGAEAEKVGGEGIHAVGEARGVDDIRGDHSIEIDGVKLDAEVAEGVDIVL